MKEISIKSGDKDAHSKLGTVVNQFYGEAAMRPWTLEYKQDETGSSLVIKLDPPEEKKAT